MIAVELFGTIHSVDSLQIAQVLSRLAPRPIPVFLEVQFVRVEDRFGFDPQGVREAFEQISSMASLRAAGLMTVAPLGLTEEETRRVFQKMRELRDAIQGAHPQLAPLELSMGMTDDFELAIEEGATVVRVGRAIFAE
jgi:uncharacterized pyridoxal phosphate-containing UPF0001 family protein